MNIRTISSVLGLAALIVLVGIGVGVFSTAKTPVNADGMEKPIAGNSVHISGTFTPDADEPTFGAVSVLQSPLEVSGSINYFDRKPLRNATSSAYTFRLPSGTSTAVSIACVIPPGKRIYDSNWEIGLSDNAFATTSVLARRTIGSGGGVVKATTTIETGAFMGGTDGAMPSRYFINLREGTSSVLTNIDATTGGFCTAEGNVI